MNRTSCLSFCVALATILASGIASAGDLIINLGGGRFEEDVKPRARQIIAASGNGLGHNSTTDENNYDYHSFTANFSASSDNTKLASFSDDQVTVYITDTTTGEMSSGLGGIVGQGVALEDIDHSLVELNYQFTAGRVYSIRVEYKNIKYTGNGDIDGVVLFAYNGGGTVVPQVEIFVRAKRSGTAEAWSSSTAVCAGGIVSNAHIAEIEIRTTPATPGYAITTSLIGGSGESTGATLTIGSSTGSDGKIRGELVSSDKVESATLIAGNSAAHASFDWNLDWTNASWTSSPANLAATSTQSVTLVHHGEPVNGHHLRFVVSRLRYTDAETGDSVVTSDSSTIASILAFAPTDVTTDSAGSVSSQLDLNFQSTISPSEATLSCYDLSVLDESAYNTEVALQQRPIKTKTATTARKSKFRKNGDVTILNNADSRTQVGGGTTPSNGAKVSPGQTVTLLINIEDPDEELVGKEWKKFLALKEFGETRTIVLGLTNATFVTGDPETKLVTAKWIADGRYSVGNILVKINQGWTGAQGDPVIVDLNVGDQITIPPDWLAEGGNDFDLRDGLPVTDLQLKWTKASVFPKTQNFVKQAHEGANGLLAADPMPGSKETTPRLALWYLYDGDPAGQNYAGVTVDEDFGDWTGDIKLVDIKPGFAAEAGMMTDADVIPKFIKISGTSIGGTTTTFTISPDNYTVDTIRPKLPEAVGSTLVPASRNKKFLFSITQTFRCPPTAAPIGKTIIKEWYDNGDVKIQAVR